MRRFNLVLALAVGVASIAAAQPPEPVALAETLAEVRVHGNHSTPDADIVALAGVTIGQAATPDLVDVVAQRLRASRRFDRVEVRKRYRSLTESGAVVLILLVSEPARGSIGIPNLPRILVPIRKLRDGFMFMPVLTYADGYGLTYGARGAFADVFGRRSRVTVPLTWGGVRRVAVETEKRWRSGPVGRLEGGASLSQRENPHYRVADRRTELRVRAERELWHGIRAGGGLGWTDVSFGGPGDLESLAPRFDVDDRFVTLGADVSLDTRLDPTFPRDAVFLRTAWEALRFEGGSTVHRVDTEARGYLGLVGSAVLSMRARYARASAPLPPYEQWLLGGASTLRGYRAGTFVGDTLFTTSAEVRLPVTSPLKVGKTGVTVFVDSGTVTGHGSRLRDARMHSGAGVGFFIVATVFQLNLDVARGFDGGTRVHVMTGFSF